MKEKFCLDRGDTLVVCRIAVVDLGGHSDGWHTGSCPIQRDCTACAINDHAAAHCGGSTSVARGEGIRCDFDLDLDPAVATQCQALRVESD
jgi:hypothetical protein